MAKSTETVAIGRPRIRIELLLTLILFISGFNGCQGISDENQAIDETKYRLHCWCEILALLKRERIDVSKHTSINELVDTFRSTGMGRVYNLNRLRYDCWNRPFRMESHHEPETNDLIIVISSAGRNGVLEMGKGDDISTAITVGASAVTGCKYRTP
jgi:hypothetical protein